MDRSYSPTHFAHVSTCLRLECFDGCWDAMHQMEVYELRQIVLVEVKILAKLWWNISLKTSSNNTKSSYIGSMALKRVKEATKGENTGLHLRSQPRLCFHTSQQQQLVLSILIRRSLVQFLRDCHVILSKRPSILAQLAWRMPSSLQRMSMNSFSFVVWQECRRLLTQSVNSSEKIHSMVSSRRGCLCRYINSFYYVRTR